jgi:cell division protein FtsZ
MVFITAGMGGGTGTGAAPIIAQAAREMGILTVGVVTKPFQFEGTKRMRQADEGIEALHKVVDTLLIIPNQNLFRIANEKTTFTEAFALADDVLYQGVKGVTDLMVKPGLINLDFADVRSVMDEMGKAMMGTGEASGENRAQEAAERAIANPLLDEVSLNGAKGVLINITGGYDMTLFELDEAANVIRDKVDSDANIIVGSTLDPDMDGSIRVSVVATGIDAAAAMAEVPAPRRTMAEPLTQNPQVSQRVEIAPQGPQGDDLPPRRVGTPLAESRPVAPAPRIEDEMPAPAYQRKEAAQPMALNVKEDAGFIAPRAPQGASRGQASPETLERLRRAVENKGERQQPQPAPQEPVRAQSRMAGLGRMLERMAGHSDQAAPKPAAGSISERVNERVAVRARQQDADFDDLASPDASGDNVEIPAFLRRQAN